MSDPYAAYGGAVASGAASDPYAAYGGTVATPPVAPDAPKSLLQRAQDAFDKLTTVTPEQRAGHGAVVNAAQEFGAGAIQGAGAPIVHPSDTLDAIGHTIAHPIDTAKAVAKSAMDNPAKFAGNLVGGALLGEAAAPVAEGISGGVQKASTATQLPQKLYESALKPSTTLSTSERAAITQTGLKNGILVNPDGVEKVANLIGDYNTKIKAAIASDPTRQISTAPAMRNLQSVRDKFQTQVTPGADLLQIDAVGKEFSDKTPSGSMNADDAQAMKQGTYRALGSKSYGEVKGASIEAQKSLARGLKDEIANQFPEIGNMNSAESKLLNLQDVLERAVNRSANHQLIGIGTPIVGTAVHSLTGSGPAGLAMMLMKSVVDDPVVKSRLAIALSKGGKIPYSQAAARVQAYSSALAPTAAGSTAPDAPGYSPDAPPSQ